MRILIKKSEHSIVDFSLTLAPKTLRIHQRQKGFVLKDQLKEAPWPELITSLIFVWLIILTYSGSFSDGQLDQVHQIFLNT